MAKKKKDPIEQEMQMQQEAQAAEQATVIQQKAEQDVAKMQAVARQEEKAQQEIIGKEAVHKATETLQEYKNAKASLEQKIVENEEWFKMRRNLEKEEKKRQSSAWLFNSIANKHADAMDNYPEPNVLARAADDDQAAKTLSAVLPVILEYNNYEQVYSDTWWYKLKQGTGVKKIIWDSKKNNGMGDVEISKVDILSIFWQPGISDIQDSRNFFHVELVDNEVLKAQYPDADLGGSPTLDVKQYYYTDNIDTSDKSAVVDWYYKKNAEGKETVHYCKYVNETVLYASENDPDYAIRGFYDHGKYPFVFDTLFLEEGTPAGFGYIDVMKGAQMYIDKLNDAILENALMSAKKRYFVRPDGNVNEDEFADFSKTFVHTNGNVGEDAIREIQNIPLSDIYMTTLNNKIEELKETSGNRDFSQGSTASGVTAASAIAALQEAGSKLSRDMLKSAYRAFAQECYLVLELVRQFYAEPRYFRIIGENGSQQFQSFDNSMIQPQPQVVAGEDMGERLPIFDIEVVAAKKSTYSRMAQNELALQFYGLGFFEPQRADQSLSCLEMMDFEGKEKVIQKVSQGQTLLNMLQQMQAQMMKMGQIIDAQNGTTITQGIAGEVVQNDKAQQGAGIKYDSLGGASQKNTATDQVKERVNSAAAPK